jgi:leucyl-tRNA synthetase
MLNGKKMSKSIGNSTTLRDGVKTFGADAMRLSLADAGDGVEDANFDEKTANADILRLHELMTWCEYVYFVLQETTRDESDLFTDPKNPYPDRVFEEEVIDLINITKSHYDARECRSAIMILAVCFRTGFKDARKFGFYGLKSARDWYREVTADIGMQADPVKYWISVATLMITLFALTLRSTLEETVEGASFRPAGFMARPRTRCP